MEPIVMRVVAAVVVSWLLWGFLESGIYAGLSASAPETFPPAAQPTATVPLLIMLVLRTGYSLAAGALAGWIGRKRTTSMIAAAVLLITGIIVQVMNWALGPAWYHLTFLVLIVPAAMLGASWFDRESH
jgi:hypothetical protein